MDALNALIEEAGGIVSSFDPVPVFSIGSFGVTQYMVWMVIIFLIVVAVVLAAAKRVCVVPGKGLTGMVEYGYDFIGGLCADTIGHGYKKHIPFMATLFFFIFVSNVIGIIPGCKTPTGAISVTWALAIISFCYFVFWGIKAHGGWGYVKSLAPSGLPIALVPVVWLLEAFSTMLRALTLAVRLYANMFAGHMLLAIFSLATSIFITSAVQNLDFVLALPAIGWFAFLTVMYILEMLVAFIQAYVFTILSAVYVSLATSDH